MATIVAFPIIGGPIPEVEPEHAFQAQVKEQPPHWLFHLAVRTKTGKCVNRFAPVSPDRLRKLCRALGLRGGFHIDPREFLHGALPNPESCSPYAFGQQTIFPADSSLLALTVGLVGAATERSFPPSVVLSGCLDDPLGDALRLTRTTKIEQKVTLTFGCDPGYRIQPLLERLYQHTSTANHLGSLDERIKPSDVRLVIIPTDVDTNPPQLKPPLLSKPVPPQEVGLRDFGQDRVEEVLRRVDEIAQGSRLLVQVPTAFHALHLLGYHHVHKMTHNRLTHLLAEPIRVYRISHEGDNPSPTSTNSFDVAIQNGLLELENRLAKTKALNIYTKLKVILQHCCQLLHCQSGDITIVGPDPDWLRVVARVGADMADLPHLPHLVPRFLGSERLQRPQVKIVKSTAADEEYRAALSAISSLSHRFGDELSRQYQQFLARIQAYVSILLRVGGRTLGVLYLHRHRAGAFDPKLVRLVEVLAERAAREIARFLDEEDKALQRTAPLWGTGSAESLAARVAKLPQANAQAELGSELAHIAYQRTEAYRAAVRLLIGETLVTIGYDGLPELGPEEVQAPSFTLDQQSAAGYAIRNGASYIIPDTSQGDLHLHPIVPEPRAHAAIPLRVGGHVLGVLNVDWDKPGACSAAVQSMLEELASRYALAIKAFSTDELFAQVEQLCAAATRDDSQPDYQQLVQLVVRMVGGRWGALVLRRPGTNRYYLAASLLHPEWCDGEHWYEPGDGVTGWVIKHNRPVRIANLRNAQELAALKPEPAVWRRKHPDGEERQDADYTFLAVPVSVGDEVLGVLRVGSTQYHSGFGSYDQQIALSAAARLAGWLYQRQQRCTEMRRQQPADEEAIRCREFYQAADQLLDSFTTPQASTPEELRQQESHLLTTVAQPLLRELGSEPPWIWIADHHGTFFCCTPPAPEPWLQTVGADLGRQTFIAVGPWENNDRLRSLVDLFSEPQRGLLSGKPCLAIVIACAERPLAILFAAVQRDNPSLCEVARPTFEKLGQVLGGRRVAHSPESQPSRPADAPPEVTR